MKRKAKSQATHSGLAVVNPNAAAIDIGATMHVAAVGADRASDPVRSFGTFTADLRRQSAPFLAWKGSDPDPWHGTLSRAQARVRMRR